ncbi:MAG TPA: prephenate dehydrogenase/arogenate dehydrogenase family protein [Candidatus Hydrogenedentes bacterium]|nr:prephenate dehydrogenase/arogenate dehydrogenase family protein [Candidatus Hydrogenedentota bacterium]
MGQSFGTVTIIGAGLLGASLGLALRTRGLAGRVRGVGHRQSSLDAALAVGAADEVSLDARAACAGADLIVICTPANMVAAKLDEIRPVCAPDAVVTDVASTKGRICAHAVATWPAPRRFVGSHPMAGSEKFGAEYGDAGLYAGSVVIMEPSEGVAQDAYATVRRLWECVGSRIAVMEPQRHDALVARTSHIPHIVAACLAELADAAGDVRVVAGKGFRDVTRIAEGRPELWRDICLTNRESIVSGLDALSRRLDEVCAWVGSGSDASLEAFFEAARRARLRVIGE